jgi:creatinine amidohydrolase
MSSPRVRSLVSRGDLDILIPLGALEQHGPHLPLGTDTLIAEAIAVKVAQRVDNLLVAPCLSVGCSDHHLSFPGTASIPEEVVAGYIRSTVLSLLGHGFRNAYVVSGHAGNIDAMKAAMRSLPSQAGTRVAAFVDWPAQRAALQKWAETSFGLSGDEVGSHAGHFETSILLDLTPDLVDMSVAPRGFIGSAEEAAQHMTTGGMAAVSDIGVLGDARSATAAAGAGYLEVLVASIAAFIEKHRAAAPDDA